jgi:hypothetical protein
MREVRAVIAYPKKLGTVVDALRDYGWNFMVNHGKDTGDSPFISIEARREKESLMITWHTRATGAYRLFTCMADRRDVTLAKALERITS